MKDVLSVLFAIGILVAGFIAQTKKDAKKETPSKPVPPGHPKPENGESDTPGIPATKPDIAPATPPSQPKPIHKPMQNAEKRTKSTPRPFLSHDANGNTTPRTTTSPAPAVPPVRGSDGSPSGINAADIEEVRKSVIWSAILQRPY